ncbi:hypothetical protein [Streptomyces sp. NPDC005438]|uniref:hypothetical protein n=1 Tax=Streptomyces sp. NPDC005438 TaxID=3156880 RepID=UPI0033BC3E1A
MHSHQDHQTVQLRRHRAPRSGRGAYVVSGFVLLAYGGLLAGRQALRAWQDGDLGSALGSLPRGLVDPTADLGATPESPYVWVFVAALLVAGLGALFHRPHSRGAALVLAWVLAALSVRELLGMRAQGSPSVYGGVEEGVWIPLLRWAGLLGALVVLVLLTRTGHEPPRGGPRGAQRFAGALLLGYGALRLGWTARNLWVSDASFTGYARNLVDSSAPAVLEGSAWEFPEAALALGMVLVGLALWAGRAFAPSAALLLTLAEGYLLVRFAVGTQRAGSANGGWGTYLDDGTGMLSLATAGVGALSALLVPALLATVRREPITVRGR